MKDKPKQSKPKPLTVKTRSSTKIITNKQNIKTQEVEKRRVLLQIPPMPKKNNIQASLRNRKRKERETIKADIKNIDNKRGQTKSKRKVGEEGVLRPAHSVEVRRNRFNFQIQQSKVQSLSANKKLKRSIESVREIMKASFNKTIQLTPSSCVHDIMGEQFNSKKSTIPIELFRTLNNSKKLRTKPNSRRNSQSKPDSFISKQNLKFKKPLKKKRVAGSGSVDQCWPRTMLQDRVSDVLRLSTSEDKGSIIQSTEIQKAILTQNQDFNIQELRQLEFKAKILNKNNRKLEGQSNNSYFNSMATKIQRFWKEYKTKKILSRHITPHQSYNNTIDIPYQSLQLYGDSVPERHNTYISHLQNSECSSKPIGNEQYESMIKSMKNQQLQKWDQLIEMVQQSIKDNTGTKQLLKKLIEQSYINKLSLQENTEEFLLKTGNQKIKSFKSSPDNSFKDRSSIQKQIRFISSNSVCSPNNSIDSVNQARQLQPQFQELQRVSKLQKLFNYRGIQRIKQSLPLKTEEEQDPIQTKITVEKLQQKLFQLNDHSAQRAGRRYDDDFSPCLKRDKRSLDKSREQDILQSSQQSIDDDDQQINPVGRLIKLILQDVDKEKVCSEITQHLLIQQTSLLLKDMAMSSKVYRQLKVYLREGKPQIKVNKQKKMKGMRSNLAAVKQYIKSLGDYILNLETQPLKTLQQPSGPTTKQMLRYMRFYQQQEQESESGDQQITLPSQIFDVHWMLYSEELKLSNKLCDKQQSEIHQDFLKRLTNIHCKLIFDTLNQSLDMLRNYGQFGKPFPWKKVPNFFHKFQQKDQKQSLQNAVQRTVQVASSFCGLILDKQQYGGAPLPSQDYIQQMRQQRLSRTLAQQLIQGEQKWLFYDDQETQILIQISYAINEQLISEVAKFLLAHYL